ncbi:intermembrane transport protein PqiB [Bordetella sp. FB-8]|uniref:PqiB family protein n=1 Tax=Bordetella sp. FB-8 TaxID=1159870 RepID=UPI0003636F5B|nr:MlaD family protein [Bordetella sp. FB-8]
MADQTSSPDKPAVLSAAVRKSRRRISWIWLVPLVAALAGVSMVLHAWLKAGPDITIQFDTAEGLVAGQTQVRYKDVVIGTVQRIYFSDDRSKVMVEAALNKDAADIARQGTRFWVVRPRLGFSGVSGLGTLLSGAYIDVDVPKNARAVEQDDFVGLETPPPITHDRAGKIFTLRAENLGSLDVGSPVYFRRISVGRVVGYRLEPSGAAVDVDVFVDAPNDRFVTRATRFWNASGVDVSVNGDGVKMRTESLVSLLLGGVAFDTPADDGHDKPAAANTEFKLYAGQAEAQSVPRGFAYPVQMRFNQSVRGLSVGATVEFQGIALGKVTAIEIAYDMKKRHLYTVVDATLYPELLGQVLENIETRFGSNKKDSADQMLAAMIRYGMRAQLRPVNLLSGQLYVAIDNFPNAPPVQFVHSDPPVIPTVPGQLDQLQEQVGNILNKLDKVPFDQIGTALRDTLSNTSHLMKQLDTQVAPQARDMFKQAQMSLQSLNQLIAPDASLPSNTQNAMVQIDRAARSLRALADYLQTHPEALLRGRGPDPIPGAGPSKH